MAGERILLQRVLNQHREPVHAFAHVGITERQVHFHARRNDHHGAISPLSIVSLARHPDRCRPEQRRAAHRPGQQPSCRPAAATRSRRTSAAGCVVGDHHSGQLRSASFAEAELHPPAEQHAGDDPVLARNGGDVGARAARSPCTIASFSSSLKKRRTGALGRSADRRFRAAVKRLSGGRVPSTSANDTGGRRDEDARASRFRLRCRPAGRAICATRAATGAAPQHMRARPFRSSSSPRHASPRTPAMPRLRTSVLTLMRRRWRLLQRLFPLLTALLAAQFRLIFRKLARSFLASKMLQPAPECVLVRSILTAIFRLAETASPPRLDVNRPPLAPALCS